MTRVIDVEDQNLRLGQELDSLRNSSDVVYVSKGGRLAAVLVGMDRYATTLDRLDFLADSLAALQARNETAPNVGWSEVRGS
ncbi:MAG: hypothetical protein ABI334_02305 [Candidatus Dormiibacterota bacterium]